jgi:tRNA(Ile)-lysidine synthase TilS/MesJ
METFDRARAEESLRGKFRKKLFVRFAKGIADYELLQPDDKVAVCISGGKDSMLMAKLFQELKRHNKFPFELVFLVMDPGYSEANLENIKKNAQMLGVPITVFQSDIFENVLHIEKSPCYICARMRRGNLYAAAKELGCNKIALGHHYDDVIETILMAMLYGGQIQTMMPKIRSKNFAGMELIRPMYYVRESDIIAWRDYNGLKFLQCACRFTEGVQAEEVTSKRQKVKELIHMIAKDDPEIEQNIFKSVENASLSNLISYKDKAGNRHRFTEDY